MRMPKTMVNWRLVAVGSSNWLLAACLPPLIVYLCCEATARPPAELKPEEDLLDLTLPHLSSPRSLFHAVTWKFNFTTFLLFNSLSFSRCIYFRINAAVAHISKVNVVKAAYRAEHTDVIIQRGGKRAP